MAQYDASVSPAGKDQLLMKARIRSSLDFAGTMTACGGPGYCLNVAVAVSLADMQL
jgi:hypothetical protein